MEEKKKTLGKSNWTLFEVLFLIFSIAAIVGCFFFGEDKNYFSLSCSIVGVVSVLTVAKGLVWAPYINLVYNTAYAVLSYFQGFYGEFIINIVLMNAVSIMTIISWFRNRNKQDTQIVEVNKIGKKETLFLSLGVVVATVSFYFILKAFNTNELIVGTISLVGSALASYLMLRRSSWYAIGFIFNDIVLIVMWSLQVASAGLQFLPTVICFVIFLINDIYGFIHWKMEEKKQFQNKEKEIAVSEEKTDEEVATSNDKIEENNEKP